MTNHLLDYKHTQETDEQDWKYFYIVCVFNFLTILINDFKQLLINFYEKSWASYCVVHYDYWGEGWTSTSAKKLPYIQEYYTMYKE